MTALKRIALYSLRLFSGDVLARVLLFVTTVLVARRLGPEEFGLIQFALALLGYLSLFADAGLAVLGVRELSTATGERRGAWLGITLLRSGLAIALCAVALALTWVLPAEPGTRSVVALTLLSAVPLAALPDWACRGLGRMGTAAALTALQPLLALGGIVLLVREPGDALAVPGVRLAAAALTALAGLAALGLALAGQRGEGGVAWLRRRGVAPLLGSGVFLLGTNLAVLSYNSADALLLRWLAGDQAVGLYSAAYRVIQAPMAAFYALTAAALPVLSQLGRQGGRSVAEVTGRLLLGALGAGTLAAFALSFGAGPVMHLLYGEAYAAAVPVLAVLAFAIPLDFVISLKGTGYIARGLERPAAACAGAGALANLIANLLLIPQFGILGAAAATLGTYVLLFALYVRFLDPRLDR